MHAIDLWATDTHKVWGKSRMHATYIPDARNPVNPRRIINGEGEPDIVEFQVQVSGHQTNEKEGRIQAGPYRVALS